MASPSVSFAMLINCTQEQPLKKLSAISSRGGGFLCQITHFLHVRSGNGISVLFIRTEIDFTAQRKNRVGDVHENGFHAASPAKERLEEGFISITPVIASSTLS